MKQYKFYLSGKITGDENYIEKFSDAENIIRNAGRIVLNPAILPAGLSQGDYMRICLAMLDSADVVCMLDDWEESAGAKIEREYAYKVGKAVVEIRDYKNVKR